MVSRAHKLVVEVLAAVMVLLVAGVGVEPGRAMAQECPDGWRSDFDNGWAGVVRGLPGSSVTAPELSSVLVWDPDGPGPQREMLVVAGTFGQAGNIVAKNLAMFDGTHWVELSSPLLPTSIKALCVYQGRLIVAGSTFVSPSGVASEIACFDGLNWTSLGTVVPLAAAGSGVLAIAVIGDSLYVGGTFGTINGVPLAGIARWDGHTWTGLGSGFPGDGPWVLAEFQGKLIAAGNFTFAGGTPANRIAAWNGNTWSALGEGLDTYAQAICVHDNALVVSGGFLNAGGQPARFIARWDGHAWDSMGGGLVEPNARSVSMLTTYQGRLIAGSRILNAVSPPANILSTWDGSRWVSIDSRCFGLDCQAIQAALFRGKLVVGVGRMVYMSGFNAMGLAQWDGAVWSTICPGTGLEVLAGSTWLDVRINAMSMFENQLAVAGTFFSIGGVQARNIARWDGSHWQGFGAGLGAEFNAYGVGGVAVYRGELIATVAYGSNSAAVMKWNGTNWETLGQSLQGRGAIAVFQDELYVVARSPEIANGYLGLFRWNGVSWTRVPTFRARAVNCLSAYADRLLICGDQLSTDRVFSNIMSWDGSTMTTLPPAPSPFEMAQVAVFGGNIIAASGSPDNNSGGSIYKFDGATWTSTDGRTAFSAPTLLLPFRGGLLLTGASVWHGNPGTQILGIGFWDGQHWSGFGAPDGSGLCLPYGDGLVNVVRSSASNGRANRLLERWGPSAGPTFDQQPASQAICASGRTSFLAPATGSEALAYRWQFRVPAAGGWGEWRNAVNGANLDASGETQFVGYGAETFTLTTQAPTGVSLDPLGWVNRKVGLRCLVSGDCRTIESGAVELAIRGADVNCDGVVDGADLADFLGWFLSGDPRADVNHDGAVDFFDYDGLVQAIEGGG